MKPESKWRHGASPPEIPGKCRAIVETINDWLWELDGEFVFTYTSPQIEELLGYAPREVLGKPLSAFMEPQEVETFCAVLGRHAQAQIPFRGVEKRMWAQNGDEVLLESSGKPVFSADGRLIGYRGMDRDIGMRKRGEEQLRYQELFDHVDEGVVIFDSKGRVVAANDSLLAKTGYRRKELTGLLMRDFIDPDQSGDMETIWEKIWLRKKARFEINIRTRKGHLRPSEINARVITFKGEACLLCMGRDISETRLMQDKLIRSERLAATGQLSASIAHEINSPLQGVAALLNVIRKTHREDAELIQHVDLLRGAFESIRDTVKHLLDLNRPGRELKQPVNLNKTIEDTLALVRGHLRKSNVTVRLDLATDMPSIIVSPQQMGQVFLNLINNAVEAMTGLSVHDTGMKQQTFFGGEISITTLAMAEHVVIAFADNGPGISAEDLNYIFDPFYTRKKTMGMGVGLSICYGIIEDHQGSIIAENGAEGGAIFTISLPLAPQRETASGV